MPYLKKTFCGAEAKGIKCNELWEKALPIRFWVLGKKSYEIQ
jgi:hypothetical protein